MNSVTDVRTAGGADDDREADANERTSVIEEPDRVGLVAMFAGGALLAVALRTVRRRRGRGVLLATAGTALLGFGLRRRRAAGGEDETESDPPEDDDEKTVSDEAIVGREGDLGAGRNADESRGVGRSETEPNPRGVSERDDLEEDDGDTFDFVEGKEPGEHRETHLEGEDAHDTRLHPESDDEATEVDLSEAAMADEASEAAGPHPEQAFPAREGTDPEPTSPSAPERTDEGAGETADADTEEGEASPDDRDDEHGSEEADDESTRSDDEE